MTRHLLLVHLGPVQDFIAQARRTRDLWFGSHLLSELARALARTLAERAQLIFPALAKGDVELRACTRLVREDTGEPPLGIANKILAEVPAGVDARALALEGRKAVAYHWHQIGEGVRKECTSLIAPEIDEIWNEQMSSLLEFNAAWVELSDEPGAYTTARTRLDAVVAGRKLLRDFNPWKHQCRPVPRSTLDGARETVLRRERNESNPLAQKYRITPGEQLDAVGLIKRTGGDPEQFVPVTNVALACWLDTAHRHAQRELAAVREECANKKISRVDRKLPCAVHFPFEAGILLPDRWQSVFEERGVNGDSRVWGEEHVRPLLRAMSEPSPYVACLVADGDRMGKALGHLRTPEHHRRLSAVLSQFARDARGIVEQDHLGSLVYAGGDDVLAFLPLPTALACADALRQAFHQALKPECVADLPTLSVGVGIGHMLDSLGELLALGREAETLAKQGQDRPDEPTRNALAIIVDRRSGGRRTWRASWETKPVTRLHDDVNLLRGGALSSKKVHEIRATLDRMPAPDAATQPGWAQTLAQDVARTLRRTHAGESELSPDQVGLTFKEEQSYAAVHAAIRDWTERMLVARAFADAIPRPRNAEEAA